MRRGKRLSKGPGPRAGAGVEAKLRLMLTPLPTEAQAVAHTLAAVIRRRTTTKRRKPASQPHRPEAPAGAGSESTKSGGRRRFHGAGELAGAGGALGPDLPPRPLVAGAAAGGAGPDRLPRLWHLGRLAGRQL